MTDYYIQRTDGKSICLDCKYYYGGFDCLFKLIKTALPINCKEYIDKQPTKITVEAIEEARNI